MKRIITIIFLFATMFLVACYSEDERELTRVDFQKLSKERNYEEVLMITDNETVDLLKKTIENIKWEDTGVNMARNPDVKATFFYTDDKKPERLRELGVWFNENTGTGTIASIDKYKSHGELNNDNANTLKNIFLVE
ncbi:MULTISPECIES: hypothetical protein [unclassified Lysinibacillus]|uniref:hypothetical protein n=1 Tax=unclassified Lysinibacillus TaxID=2636778 RepID=UPI002012C92E|nr:MULTISPECIES: hypothetical protein [unclassified Lysinibacillus]MCL1696455.1 hypothetical protein [Lysinibacillus sp. BPa_S21]MCL1700360.1 hypothetical protein [Lysinibacillus sp. Bpr_S20]